MERLTQKDLRAILEFLQGVYASLDLKAYQHYVVSALRTVVYGEIGSYREVKPQYVALTEPPLETVPDGDQVVKWFVTNYSRLRVEHPIIAHRYRTHDPRAVKTSDFLTTQQFRRLELYNEAFRPLRAEHLMAIALTLPPHAPVGIGVMRRRDFSERERLSLDLLRPHLVQAYRNARAVDKMRRDLAQVSQVVENLPFGVIVLGPDGRVRRATPRAQAILAGYFDSASQPANRLPEALERWARHHEAAWGRIDDVYPPRKPFVVEREGSLLEARMVTDSGQRLLLLRERVTDLGPSSLQSLGLTRREAEVLALVIQGKTSAKIGAALGISPRTVAKHREHISDKLGVRTRSTAATYALEALTSSTGGIRATRPSR